MLMYDDIIALPNVGYSRYHSIQDGGFKIKAYQTHPIFTLNQEFVDIDHGLLSKKLFPKWNRVRYDSFTVLLGLYAT